MRFSIFLATAVCVVATSMAVALAADIETLPDAEPGKQDAARQCLMDLRKFDEKLTQVGFGIVPPGDYSASTAWTDYEWGVQQTPRQKIRSLRRAAFVYARDGNEKACQTVLASMRAEYEQHQKLVGNEADEPNLRTAWRRAHLSNAKPITQMNHLMRADVFIGSEIRSPKDEKLGEIEDLVMNPEKQNIIYVLISRGGFLGFGGKLVAIRWRDLRATDDHELFSLDASPKAMADAPGVNRRNFEKTATADWQRELAAYWDGVLNH